MIRFDIPDDETLLLRDTAERFVADHYGLAQRNVMLEQPPEQVGFAGARVALHEQTGREQFLYIDANALPGRIRTNFDLRCHIAYE